MTNPAASESTRNRYRVGVDIGGTFTDFVLLDLEDGSLRIEKTYTTPKDLCLGVETGLRSASVDFGAIEDLAHGTTVGLNTLLERKGAPTGLITTTGFRDAYEIGRGARSQPYNLFFRKPVPLVPREHRLEARERIGADGSVVTPLNEDDVVRAAEFFRAEGIASIAICFLNSYASSVHEQRAEEIVASVYPEAKVSTSCRLAREWREYERTSTTCINAYIIPSTSRYIERLSQTLDAGGYRKELFINQSSGGVVSARTAVTTPVMTLMSGPAGGVAAAAYVGGLDGMGDIISFDMGGTSNDVCLIQDGRPRVTADSKLESHPVMVPMVAIHSIGAGGGSLAWIDPVGALNVGPESAGAEPGPVCYGRGGTKPTVTDANIVLGRVAPARFIPENMKLDVEAARRIIDDTIAKPLKLDLLDAATGVLRIVNVKMAMAVRAVTVERGLDPQDFVLFAFGGAGPMHACFVARELGIKKVVVPIAPGQFSAFGILGSDIRHDLVRTAPAGTDALNPTFFRDQLSNLEAEGRSILVEEGVAQDAIELFFSVDIRYVGQEYTVNVPLPPGEVDSTTVAKASAEFHTLHETTYSHSNPDESIELVNLRLAAIGLRPKVRLPEVAPGEETPLASAKVDDTEICFDAEAGFERASVWDRRALLAGNRIDGPAIVADPGATTVIPPGFVCRVSSIGNLVIEVPEA
jgi:N-methylhydantoinase A